MNYYTKIVFESKDSKTFQKDVQVLINTDTKAKTLAQNFKRDSDKIVDFIDYIMVKYEKQLDNMMKKYNVGYDEAIDLITKGI